MPHIHTGSGEHDHTSSVYLVRTDLESAPQMTFLEGHKIFSSKRMQIGGHEELLENPWQAALRELREESGYLPDQDGLYVMQPSYYLRDEGEGDLILPFSLQTVVHDFDGNPIHKHIDTAYALLATQPPEGERDEGESGRLIYESLGGVESLSDDQIMRSVKRLAIFTLTVCLEQWEQVPISEFRTE